MLSVLALMERDLMVPFPGTNRAVLYAVYDGGSSHALPKEADQKGREAGRLIMAEAGMEAAALLKRQVRASYDAAPPSRSRKAWGLLGGSPAGDIVRDVAGLRARSRDLYRAKTPTPRRRSICGSKRPLFASVHSRPDCPVSATYSHVPDHVLR